MQGTRGELGGTNNFFFSLFSHSAFCLGKKKLFWSAFDGFAKLKPVLDVEGCFGYAIEH